MSKTIAVLTGDGREARIYLESQGIDVSRLWYVTRPESLRGVDLDLVYEHRAPAVLKVEARLRAEERRSKTRWLDLRQLRAEAPLEGFAR